MSGDSEPLLSDREEPILPITDRRTPVLDRIRERRRKRNSIGYKVGAELAELSVLSSEEERAEKAGEVREEFVKGLSDGLGVPEDSIEPDLINEFAAMFTLDHEDILVVDEDINEEEEQEDSESEDGEEEDETVFG